MNIVLLAETAYATLTRSSSISILRLQVIADFFVSRSTPNHLFHLSLVSIHTVVRAAATCSSTACVSMGRVYYSAQCRTSTKVINRALQIMWQSDRKVVLTPAGFLNFRLLMKVITKYESDNHNSDRAEFCATETHLWPNESELAYNVMYISMQNRSRKETHIISMYWWTEVLAQNELGSWGQSWWSV